MIRQQRVSRGKFGKHYPGNITRFPQRATWKAFHRANTARLVAASSKGTPTPPVNGNAMQMKRIKFVII